MLLKYRFTAFHFCIVLFLCLGMYSCGGSKAAFGERGYTEEGKASYYSRKLHGRKMANGKPYNRHKLTAAHKSLPMGTKVKVTNPANGKSVKVKITDRGPYAKGRIIDLSEAGAKRLNYVKAGVVPVKVKVIKSAKKK